jgi:hypothetical protein
VTVGTAADGSRLCGPIRGNRRRISGISTGRAGAAVKRYWFAGQVLGADREIHGLAALHAPRSRSWLEVCATPIDVRPKRVRRWAYRWLNDDGSVNLALARRADGYLLRFPGACDFLFDRERQTVWVSPVKRVDEAIIEHLLLDQVLPRILAHRGELAAHCSAVAAGHGAAIFLGRTGWGKSTLAGLMHRQGCALLSDDCVLLRPQSGRVVAVPTYRSLRLWPESLDRVFPSAELPVGSGGAKHRLRASGDDGEVAPRPVNAVYVLNDPAENRQTISIEPISPAALCLALIRHSFRLDVADRAEAATFLGLCAAVARSVPAFALSYPREFDEAPALVHTLSRHLEGIGRSLQPESAEIVDTARPS